MATLIVSSGPHAGRVFPLGHRTTVVGRDEGLLVQILDKYVSRKHMRVRYDPQTGSYFVGDLLSLHGLFLNGQPVHGEVALSHSDVIELGTTTLLFSAQDLADQSGAPAYSRQCGQRSRETLAR